VHWLLAVPDDILCLYFCRSFATKVYYVVTVGGVEISSMPNIVVPSRAIIASRLMNSRLSMCQCRAKRNWRVWIHGSPATVSSMLSTIQSSIRQAWAWSLRFVRKRSFLSCHIQWRRPDLVRGGGGTKLRENNIRDVTHKNITKFMQ